MSNNEPAQAVDIVIRRTCAGQAQAVHIRSAQPLRQPCRAARGRAVGCAFRSGAYECWRLHGEGMPQRPRQVQIGVADTLALPLVALCPVDRKARPYLLAGDAARAIVFRRQQTGRDAQQQYDDIAYLLHSVIFCGSTCAISPSSVFRPCSAARMSAAPGRPPGGFRTETAAGFPDGSHPCRSVVASPNPLRGECFRVRSARSVRFFSGCYKVNEFFAKTVRFSVRSPDNFPCCSVRRIFGPDRAIGSTPAVAVVRSAFRVSYRNCKRVSCDCMKRPSAGFRLRKPALGE